MIIKVRDINEAEALAAFADMVTKLLPNLMSYQRPLPQLLHDIDAALVGVALSFSQGNKAQAARLLGIKRTTLVQKCHRYGYPISQTAAQLRESRRTKAYE